MTLARRRLIVGLLGTAASGSAAGYLLLRRHKPANLADLSKIPGDRGPIVLALVELFPSVEHLKLIGEQAISTLGISSLDGLTDELFPAPVWDQVEQADALALLRSQIKADFAAGRSETVGGWILARSEALLYALVAKLGIEHSPRSHGSKSPKRGPGTGEAKATQRNPKAAAAPGDEVGDPGRGRRIYQDFCSGCHQVDGRGLDGMLAADLNAADGPLTKTDAQLLETIRNGMSANGRPMPGFEEVLDEAQMRDLLAYLRHQFGAKLK